MKVAACLGNIELRNRLLLDETAINQSRVGRRLRHKLAVCRSLEDEIEFTASHFCELAIHDLKGTDLYFLEVILTSESLRVGSENALLSFICHLDAEYRNLLLTRMNVGQSRQQIRPNLWTESLPVL
jgi:hypothetical protein